MRAEAEWRLKVLKLFWEIEEKRTRAEVEVLSTNAELRTEAETKGYALSVASIYRWDEWYKESGGDIRSLLQDTEGRRGGAGQKRFPKAVQEEFEGIVEEIYLVREKVSMKDVYKSLNQRITKKNRRRKSDEKLRIPSYNTVTRWINDWDLAQLMIAKFGEEVTMRKLRQYGKMNYATEPLARVESDFTPMDLMVLGPTGIPYGRLDILLSICTATAYPTGYSTSFGRGYPAVMEWLRHAIMPKNSREQYGTQNEWLAYGIHGEIVPDNALEFGLALQEACLMLGSAILPAHYRTPTQKPAIERYIRTKHQGLIHTLPGTTFSNYLEKGDYDSAEQACIFIDQLDEILNIFFVDVYAQTKHPRLGCTPAQSWNQKVNEGFYPNIPGSVDELEIILRASDYRVLEHYGIDFHYLRYNIVGDIELGILRNRMKEKRRSDKKSGDGKSGQVKIKFNPNDLGHVYVFDPFEERYIKVPSLDPEYTKGLTLYQHKIIKDYAKHQESEVNMETLWIAREEIRTKVMEGLERKNKLKVNKRLARFVTGGKSTRDQEPSAVIQPMPESDMEDIPEPPSQQGAQPLFRRRSRDQKGGSSEPTDSAT